MSKPRSNNDAHDQMMAAPPSPPPPFPTGRTVPFPYSEPYPQQVALMDALLQCLRMREAAEESNKNSNNIGGAHDVSAGGNAMTDHQTKKIQSQSQTSEKKRRASIIMLESPTGTGKSLSLACSAVAWLRYREEVDLRPGTREDGDDATDGQASGAPRAAYSGGNDTTKQAKVVTPSPTNASSSGGSNQTQHTTTTGLDWIDSFLSPDERAEEERAERVEDGRRRALAARRTLADDLGRIRDRLDRAAANVHTSAGGTAANDKAGKAAVQAKVRAVRENLVRSAATAAAIAERKQKRNYRHRRGNGKGKGSVVKRSRSGSGGGGSGSANDPPIMPGDKDMDYCLDEYNSDDNEGPAGASSSSGIIDDSSDDEDDVGAGQDLKASTNSANRQGQHHQQQQEAMLPSELLAGGKLDGSDYDPSSRYRNAGGNDDDNTDQASTKASSSSPVDDPRYPTIGSVQPGSGVRKIVYAARTHSQLSQFVGELRRTAWGADLRVVALGGRKLLCGNKDVLGPKHRSEKIITERCLDLQKGKKSGSSRSGSAVSKAGEKRKIGDSSSSSVTSTSTSGCPLLSSREAVSALAVHVLARPSDIEDIGSLGKASHACAYYASRGSLTAAEVVVVPYNTLLSTQARAAVGLSLHNSLVVIDEAHNVPEALRSLSSSRLTLPIIKAATEQLTAYTRKYASRLAGRNLFYLGQIRRCLTAMNKYLGKKPVVVGRSTSASNTTSKMMSGTELLFAMRLDNLNLFKILRYLERSRLSQKLLGFTNHDKRNTDDEPNDDEDGDDPDFVSKHVSAMSIVQTFLSCLTGSHREGKVVVEWPDETSADLRARSTSRHPTFRYVLLNPAAHFTDVLNEAYAVVLAGGTLRPFSHVAAELVASTGRDADIIVAASKAEANAAASRDSSIASITTNITTFTCDHVVSSSHVQTIRLAIGPTSTKLDFRHASRTSDAVCDELGRALINVVGIVPAGLVVFLPSYAYEAHLMRRWNHTKVLDQVRKKKKVYREPKNSRDVEKVLDAYSRDAVATGGGGAILFSVIGGKMSEGINFANDMARCVLVVGLPYPDITDPEMQEKMKSLDKEFKENGGNGINGQSYYHNLCMRAVNQSIGRAIRHAQDYAAVVLCDQRYSADARIWRALPKWLRGEDAFKQKQSFGQAMGDLRHFFEQRGR